MLKKLNTLWDKVSTDVEKEFDSIPLCYKILKKTKTKSYCHEATHFHNKDMHKAGSNNICLAVIMNDPALQDKNYHPHVFKRM